MKKYIKVYLGPNRTNEDITWAYPEVIPGGIMVNELIISVARHILMNREPVIATCSDSVLNFILNLPYENPEDFDRDSVELHFRDDLGGEDLIFKLNEEGYLDKDTTGQHGWPWGMFSIWESYAYSSVRKDLEELFGEPI